jgi:hypothetical protein
VSRVRDAEDRGDPLPTSASERLARAIEAGWRAHDDHRHGVGSHHAAWAECRQETPSPTRLAELALRADPSLMGMPDDTVEALRDAIRRLRAKMRSYQGARNWQMDEVDRDLTLIANAADPRSNRADRALLDGIARKPDGWHAYHVCGGQAREVSWVAQRDGRVWGLCVVCGLSADVTVYPAAPIEVPHPALKPIDDLQDGA